MLNIKKLSNHGKSSIECLIFNIYMIDFLHKFLNLDHNIYHDEKLNCQKFITNKKNYLWRVEEWTHIPFYLIHLGVKFYIS